MVIQTIAKKEIKHGIKAEKRQKKSKHDGEKGKRQIVEIKMLDYHLILSSSHPRCLPENKQNYYIDPLN